MNSTLKPVGVPPSTVPQQLNKPLHQNAPTTYGQPLSHIPQNLANLPHTTPIPANAHSNNITTNHYSVNASNVSQPYALSGGIPPPSNHPVANVNQSSPTKTTAYNISTNNVLNSYKVPVPTTTEDIPDSQNVVVEESLTEKLQSNGTLEQKSVAEQELSQILQDEATIKDKPPPSPQIPDVPEAPTISIDKPSETVIATATLEKPSEIVTSILPVEQVIQSSDVKTTTVEAVTSTVPTDLSEIITSVSTPISTKTISITSIDSESITSSTPSLETSTAPSITTTTFINNAVSSKIEKVVSSNISQTTEFSITKPVTVSNLNLSVTRPKEQNITKPTLKLATTHRSPVQKNKSSTSETAELPKITKSETSEQAKINKSEIKIPNQKSTNLVAKTKRSRTRTQPYQSPLPEVEMISKISAIASTSKTKNVNDKLIVFYKNEFLALRNPEGGFYICQVLHNVHKSTRKLRILWLTQDKSDGDIFTPDFYDHTDFDCILTNINLTRIGKGRFKLPDKERIRTDNILKRALAVEKGDTTACPTEEHPDGLDLSLFKEESQLRKGKRRKRKASPLKTSKMTGITKSPELPKVRRIESKPKPPPITKALVIKKALAVKAKETAAVTIHKHFKTKPVEHEGTTFTKSTQPVDQKKSKALAKMVKRPAAPTHAPLPPVPQPLSVQLPSSSTKSQLPRKQSTKTDIVVPFLRKEPPILKKEVSPMKKEFLMLKKEGALMKKEGHLKKDISVKKNLDVVSKKDATMVVRKEMPLLKKEVPSLPVKREVPVPKQVLTRKSNRAKK